MTAKICSRIRKFCLPVFAWILRYFGPGLGAIALAAAVLLLSDLPKAAKTEKTFKVAMLQMASQPIMDEGANGVISGLEIASAV